MISITASTNFAQTCMIITILLHVLIRSLFRLIFKCRFIYYLLLLNKEIQLGGGRVYPERIELNAAGESGLIWEWRTCCSQVKEADVCHHPQATPRFSMCEKQYGYVKSHTWLTSDDELSWKMSCDVVVPHSSIGIQDPHKKPTPHVDTSLGYYQMIIPLTATERAHKFIVDCESALGQCLRM